MKARWFKNPIRKTFPNPLKIELGTGKINVIAFSENKRGIVLSDINHDGQVVIAFENKKAATNLMEQIALAMFALDTREDS